jgi:hypothetical protein
VEIGDRIESELDQRYSAYARFCIQLYGVKPAAPSRWVVEDDKLGYVIDGARFSGIIGSRANTAPKSSFALQITSPASRAASVRSARVSRRLRQATAAQQPL